MEQKKVQNPRFVIADSEDELLKLDDALLKLGYIKPNGKPDTTAWYKEMKRRTIVAAELNNKSFMPDDYTLATMIMDWWEKHSSDLLCVAERGYKKVSIIDVDIPFVNLAREIKNGGNKK